MKIEKTLFTLMVVTIALCGCGTLIPGPRYTVTVSDFSFTDNGTGVFYLEDRCRYYIFLRRYRQNSHLYLYDRQRGKHRFIAATELFSASPFGPSVLYAPPWGTRFRHKGRVPDFYVLDYRKGERMGFRMPAGFDDGYLSYGFPLVEWNEDGSLTAYVRFRYAPGERPTEWLRQGGAPVNWHTELWNVSIDPGERRGEVAEAEPCEADRLPDIPWSEIRRKKFVSSDGRSELAFSKFDDYLSFNSELAIVDRETGERSYVVKEKAFVGVIQAGKYIIYSIIWGPLELLVR